MNHDIPPAGQPQDPDSFLDPLIDQAVLNQLLDDVGLENAGVLLETFCQEIVGQARALEESATKGDLGEMARAAHRLKGSAAAFGAARLLRVVLRIEGHARAGEREPAVGLMAELQALAQASLEAVRRIQGDSPAAPL